MQTADYHQKDISAKIVLKMEEGYVKTLAVPATHVGCTQQVSNQIFNQRIAVVVVG